MTSPLPLCRRGRRLDSPSSSPRDRERRPVERMGYPELGAAGGEAGELPVAQRLRALLAPGEVAEELLHQEGGFAVRYLPQARNDTLRAGQHEGLAQAGHPLAVAHVAEPGFA